LTSAELRQVSGGEKIRLISYREFAETTRGTPAKNPILIEDGGIEMVLRSLLRGNFAISQPSEAVLSHEQIQG